MTAQDKYTDRRKNMQTEKLTQELQSHRSLGSLSVGEGMGPNASQGTLACLLHHPATRTKTPREDGPDCRFKGGLLKGW